MANMDRNTPRRFCQFLAGLGGGPRVVAGTATLLALVLAIAPGGLTGGVYSAELAVLTATLIALIWYAYFTFRVARPPVQLNLDPGVRVDHFGLTLRPAVKNLSDRQVRVRLKLEAYVDGRPVELSEFYRGRSAATLDPGQGLQGKVLFKDHLEFKEPDDYGDRFPRSQTVLIALQATWVDELCEPGQTAPIYWHVDLQNGDGDAVVDPVRIAKLFEPLSEAAD